MERAYCVFDLKDKIFCKMFVLINIYFDFILWKYGRSTKGGLISEKMNFPPMTLNNLFKISAQGSNLAPFIGNGSKVEITSEI